MDKHVKNQNGSYGLNRLIQFSIQYKAIVLMLILLAIGYGILVSPFDWKIGGPLRNPIPVDAIPDIGENQQIVFTRWEGRSPKDVEDQISYPLTVSLLGIPGVKNIRSYSMFGFSTVYVIFDDKTDFYWGRSRILEKLNSLPVDTLPEDVKPALGPDATAMGQVFWYTLEGRDDQGRPTGGWDLEERRTIQDYFVRYSLMSVEGVSEVASIGGFVKEYQIDLDPDRMRVNEVSLEDVVRAVQRANRDVGARTIDVNNVEYLVRGIGFIKNIEDLELAVVKMNGQIPVFIKQIANVSLGPAIRQGALDKSGVEAVGGVVVVRYGANPLEVIGAVKRKITEITPGLPTKKRSDGTVSKLRIIPFYDRTELIKETLGTLKTALTNELLVTVLVILLMLFHLGSAGLISGVLPVAVLICFLGMKLFGVDANVVALSGIAIAIGTMVDMGIIVMENIMRHLSIQTPSQNRLSVIVGACQEVSGAVFTAVATTIVGFLPVFTLEAAEGKLFKPLALTKTFALTASLITALFLIPCLVHLALQIKERHGQRGWLLFEGLIYAGVVLGFFVSWQIGSVVALIGIYHLVMPRLPVYAQTWLKRFGLVIAGLLATWVLTRHWLPLGPEKGMFRNSLFVVLLVGSLLVFFHLFAHFYQRILSWCLKHKMVFLSIPAGMVFMGGVIWQGSDIVLKWMPNLIRNSAPAVSIQKLFPGLGKEFMPPLDEGAFLFMPTTMPHASIGEVMDILQKQDKAIQALPEIDTVVGKIGRVDSALDPAPISMIETLITYGDEYLRSSEGEVLRFRFDPDKYDLFRDEAGNPVQAHDGHPYWVQGWFERDKENQLIPDDNGHPFRLWREPLDPDMNPGRDAWKGIQSSNDIWDMIVRAAHIPGTTSAAKLQPISARMVMLQSGIRSSMGIRVTGPDLESIDVASLEIERLLRQIPAVDPRTVVADRVMGKPYIEVQTDRELIAQYGVSVEEVMRVVELTVGGKKITSTVEGRQRFPVRVRYARELRDDLESLGKVVLTTSKGQQIPLMQIADITYVRGPGVIKGEDTFLAGYVIFDKQPGYSEVAVIDKVKAFFDHMHAGDAFNLPAGVSYSFTGTYENQVRSEKRLLIILPVSLVIIFVILYLQFKSMSTSMLVFVGIGVAWSGGFMMLWFYGQPWFLDFSLLGRSMRDLFQIHPIHLSVAVWVGFLALFGIASDDGVVMATYLDRTFRSTKPTTRQGIRQATVKASRQRIRPCLMTTATTILAMFPVLTSSGRGADLMIPMAIPTVGGMAFEVITMLVVPVLYCAIKEFQLKDRATKPPDANAGGLQSQGVIG